MTETSTSPTAGWYADPGGSGGQRWWDGLGWTQTVQLPPPPPIEYAVAPAAPLSQFGTALPAPVSHRSAPATSTSTRKVGIALLGLLVVAGLVLWVTNVGSGDSPATAPQGGPRGPASQAAAKLDALGLAAAEETVYAGRQSYLAFPKTSGIIEMGQTVVHLSPQDSASVALNPSGTGYCIVVTSLAPTTNASSTAVYVSTLGGLQPLATTCPAAY